MGSLVLTEQEIDELQCGFRKGRERQHFHHEANNNKNIKSIAFTEHL